MQYISYVIHIIKILVSLSFSYFVIPIVNNYDRQSGSHTISEHIFTIEIQTMLIKLLHKTQTLTILHTQTHVNVS